MIGSIWGISAIPANRATTSAAAGRRLAAEARSALVLFDYEGAWGMPHAKRYDLHATTARLLEVLARHGARAMFFVVGRLAEDHPELVEALWGAGHGIGLHGYRHERLDTLSPHALSRLAVELDGACGAIERRTGSRPVAFRAPHLLAPGFQDEAVSRMLVELGFTWMSNRELRYPEELVRPDRVPSASARALAEGSGIADARRPLGRTAFIALNARRLAADPGLGGWRPALRFLAAPVPLDRCGLVDVPVASPLDCDLLGLPSPLEDSPPELMAFARRRLVLGAARGQRPYNVTFHDWLIGSANRIRLLDAVLGDLVGSGGFVDARTWRPGPPGGGDPT